MWKYELPTCARVSQTVLGNQKESVKAKTVRCGGWPRQSRWGVRGQFYNMAPTIMFTAVVLSALIQIGQ